MVKQNNQIAAKANIAAPAIIPADMTSDRAPLVGQSHDHHEVQNTPEAAVTDTDSGAESSEAAPTGTAADPTKLYGTIEKKWTSGGVGGTGAQSATITARYLATKDIATGALDLAGSTFELTFTDVDNQSSSVITAHAFKFTEPTEIPRPEDGVHFALDGTVRIDSQPSGRLLFVDFDMSGASQEETASTPKSIGSIFMLDIPKDTEFAPHSQDSTV